MQTGYSDNVKPEQKVEDNNSQLEQKPISEQQLIDTTSSPDCINTNVVCSQSQSSKLNKIAFINYFDEETNQSCLNGLSDNEQAIFTGLVRKQFDAGIKVKISYKEMSLDQLSAINKS